MLTARRLQKTSSLKGGVKHGGKGSLIWCYRCSKRPQVPQRIRYGEWCMPPRLRVWFISSRGWIDCFVAKSPQRQISSYIPRQTSDDKDTAFSHSLNTERPVQLLQIELKWSPTEFMMMLLYALQGPARTLCPTVLSSRNALARITVGLVPGSERFINPKWPTGTHFITNSHGGNAERGGDRYGSIAL